MYNKVDNRELWGFFALCGILFLLFPILGIIIAALFAIKAENRQLVLFLIVLLILYLSALNTTKVPASDMRVYLRMYDSVPQNGYHNTLMFLSKGSTTKDVGYASLVYLLYYIFLGNHYLFIFTVSILTLSFFFVAIYKFGVKYEFPSYLIIAELLVIAFFTQYFSLTFHLVRQELATSIFFYALTFRHLSIKRFILWSIVASSIHSSIVAIIIFSIIPFMNQELTMKNMVVLVGGALSFAVLASSFGSFLLDNYELEGSIGYSVSRMAEAGGGEQDAVIISRIIYVFSALMLILSVIEMFKNRGQVVYPEVINLCFVWSVLVLGMSVSPLLQKRFYFIEYNFLPFMIFLFSRHNPQLLKVVCACAVLFFGVRFYAILNNAFQYAPFEEALTEPFFMLINMNHNY